VALFGLVFAVGCGGGGTSPDGGQTPVLSFTPVSQGQQLSTGGSLACAVAVEPETATTVTWRRGGSIVGSARSYTYAASLVGRDTLRVHAEAADAVRDFYWVIDVAPEPQTAPPAVPGATAAPGPEAVQVIMTWTRVNTSTYPIVAYDIALSYTGLVTPQNWDAARQMGSVAHVAGQVSYTATFDRANGGLVPGAEAFFAIRARDDRGQVSTEVTNRTALITTEWWIDGNVIDDAGNPLLASVGSASPLRNTNSNAAGRFRLGPFRSIDAVTVQTTTDGYYDLLTARISSSVDVEREIVLPHQYGVDAACTAYGGDFLTYVRQMTRTETSEADSAASRLWKWDHYPVSVFLPDSTTATGRQLDDLARGMLELWNAEMSGLGNTREETYLVEAASAAAADVRVAWVPDASAGYGKTSLVLPAGGVLGDVAPIRMRVDVAVDIATDQFFQEVVLHEFGHVLGLSRHSISCTGAGHLMLEGGGGGNLLREYPIHPDEIRAVRTIRRLAQGVDMRRYAP
jgi:hypothetical protein